MAVRKGWWFVAEVPLAPLLLTVLRYVEGNALRAGLVSRAEDWPWLSLHHWLHGSGLSLLDDWPVEWPGDWVEVVNQPLREEALGRVRTSAARGRPFGPDGWVRRMAEALGVDSTLRGRGRPRKGAGGAGIAGDVQNIPPGAPTAEGAPDAQANVSAQPPP